MLTLGQGWGVGVGTGVGGDCLLCLLPQLKHHFGP